MTTDGFDAIPALHLTELQGKALRAAGVTVPSPVQQAAIGEVLAGRPVVMHSGTGTGKTLAYLLPVLQQLVDDDTLRAVVVAPGVELAMQTLRVARELLPEGITAEAAVSTSNRQRQKKRVVNSTRLIVGTPDRVGDLFQRRKLKSVRVLVLDELDPILATPASDFLATWLSRSEPPLQLVVASATLGRRSQGFLERWMPDAVRVEPSADPLRQAITHRKVDVPRGQAKEITLARFVQEAKVRRAIVFVHERRVQAHLRRYLDEHGISAVSVDRESSKGERQRGLRAFRRGEVRLLLTSDAIARGLDVPEIDWVLHYDLPRNPEGYVHRAGRTGRAGREGTSVAFVEAADRGAWRRLVSALKLRLA